MDKARKWLAARNIEDIECILPDQAGVARGKMMPVQKFLEAPTMTMPGSILTQTIAGEYPEDDEQYQNDRADQDMVRSGFHLLRVPPFALLVAIGRCASTGAVKIFLNPRMVQSQ